jgi:hypothetical protein
MGPIPLESPQRDPFDGAVCSSDDAFADEDRQFCNVWLGAHKD